MAKRKRKRETVSPVSRLADARGDSASLHDSTWRPWLLAAVVALFVAQPLLPGETESWRGDGAVVVMLWLLLLVTWCLSQFGRHRFEIRFGTADALFVALLGWIAVSGLWAVEHGAPRAAINSTWQWISLGVAFFLVRQLVRAPSEARAAIVAMMALSVVLSALAMHQYFVTMPQTRRQYELNPDAALAEAGVYAPAGSRERELFEQRLASTEPFATFALANSLAGVLAAWWILMVAAPLVGQPKRTPAERRRLWLAAACSALPVFVVLLLTKSRSAYLAVAVGVAVLAGWMLKRQIRFSRRIVAAGAALIVAISAAGVLVGGLDDELLTEAPKSLGYRLQYWSATLAMIRDHPLVGCGPGNFQQYYTAYRLPEASEDVAEPHNLILEVWATAGTPAVLALLAFAGLFVWKVLRGTTKESSNLQPDPSLNAPRSANRPIVSQDIPPAPHKVIFGAMAGYPVAFVIGLMTRVPLSMMALLGGMAIASLAIWLWWPWIGNRRLNSRLPALAVLVMFIHLLASGGIGFTAVAGSLWLLVALALSAADGDRDWRLSPRWVRYTLLICSLLTAGAYYVTAYRPTLTSRAALDRALAEPQRREQHLIAATQADSLSDEPWQLLADWLIARGRGDMSPTQRELFATAQRSVVELNPRSALVAFHVGERFQRAYDHGADPQDQQNALDALHRATQLDPTNARYRAELALTLDGASRSAEAKQQASRALMLDQKNPHEDRKLRAELRVRLQRIVERAN